MDKKLHNFRMKHLSDKFEDNLYVVEEFKKQQKKLIFF